MKSFNKIAISQRVDFWADRNETRDALDQKLIEILPILKLKSKIWESSLNLMFLPVPVPNVLGDNLSGWISDIEPKGIILSGGNDIGTCLNRDFTEKTLIDYAREKKIPLLGICRGMQMLGVYSGASLKKVDGHIGTVHKISGEIEDVVNSFHSFSLSECPHGFKVTARSADGEIEAIKHNFLPWEGWMWHPERGNIQ